MIEDQNIQYYRIAKAIEYIRDNFKHQPGLDEIAGNINLSPFHFQRIFKEWAGVSPKKFLQYTTVEYAKSILKKHQATLAETADEAGLSGTGRLHDLFIHIEGMTPAEYKNGGKDLDIRYSFGMTPFGEVLTASTKKGICYLAFTDNEPDEISKLKQLFPKAQYQNTNEPMHQEALKVFSKRLNHSSNIKLHLKGTGFQIKVWEALLKIPLGQLSTYGWLAQGINHPKASRAVGTAISHNPVAYLIPCHRVIQSSGNIGGYMWGSTRKTSIIGWEAAKRESEI